MSVHVLFVSPIGEVGGAEQVLLSLVRRLPEHGIRCSVACLRPGPLVERARDAGAESFAFKEHRFRDAGKVLGGIRWLRDLARRTAPDLLHGNHMGHLYSGPASRLAGAPELWHLYDYPYQTDFVGGLTRRIPTDYALFATERVQAGYPDLQRRPHSVVYPVCVEVSGLSAAASAPDVRARHGLTPGPLLLTVARLQSHKGHRYLIEAVPAILRARPDAQFAIVGRPNGPEQEQYRESLIAECARLGVSEHVRFLGYVGDEDLIALYREATALVHPATSEGFGLTLIEAMAQGTPVIAAAADGPGELLTDGETGLLVPTGDAAALAAAAVRLLADDALAGHLRREGARYAATFRVEDMIRQTAAVYVKMLGA